MRDLSDTVLFEDKIIVETDDYEEIIPSENKLKEVEDELEEDTSIFEYGICIKCGKERSHYRWCQSCERKQCQENFAKWTSGKKSESILSLYSAIWMDGPRILWDQQNQEYKRSKVQVFVISYDYDQVNETLNELKIYLDCHRQGFSLLIQFYGISKHPENNEYLIIKQYAQNNLLLDYIFANFDNIDWEIKLHLLFYLAEDLKAIHNAGYVHRYLHPWNVQIFDNSLCAIGSFSKALPCLPLPNTEKLFG
ncbi:hypothetical protein C1645_830754 [Glomus cerebriforme]|uniref:Protein kinase domain-containing protein n=1 Tax=Glomus cerebriforme TaxID=658196 RepID=A0A397SNF9_9GLOM|nr:hypothetical protein C1645_830754 [Glomus cerebriforme]